MNRPEYDIKDLLVEIPASPDGIGYDMSLTNVYDKIKEARLEEESGVSFGIWERPLKKADWSLVELLTVEALKTQTKDLQVLCWLIESLVVMDGFSGIITGIRILTAFLDKYMKTSYPRTDENMSDEEQKGRILEWIYDTLYKRSKFVDFAKFSSGNSVNLYDYEYAVDLRNTTIRVPESSTEIIDSAKKAGKKTIEEVQNIIGVMSAEDITELLAKFEAIRSEKLNLEAMLKKLLNTEIIGVFSGLMDNLSKLESIIKPRLTIEKPVESGETVLDSKVVMASTINSREEIYDEIANLAKKLEILEKHSPSSYVLNLVVSWRDKGLLEIMNDIKAGDSEAHKLLKFLIN